MNDEGYMDRAIALVDDAVSAELGRALLELPDVLSATVVCFRDT